jgi:hypothetical protein
MKKVWGTVGLLVIAGIAAWASGAVALKPGRYSVTTVMSMNGRNYPPNTQSRCITNKDLQDPRRIFNERFMANFEPDPNCTERNLKTDGSKISYDEDCPTPAVSAHTVHVEGTVSESGYSAVRSVKPKSPRALPFVYTISAKRTGDCAQ